MFTPSLPNSFNAEAISSLHLLKSIQKGNLYLGPFETILRILVSKMIFKLQVTTCPAAGYMNLESLQTHDSGVLAWVSRSETSLLKLNIAFLMGLL